MHHAHPLPSAGQVQGGRKEGGEQFSVPPAARDPGDAAREGGHGAAERGTRLHVGGASWLLSC